MEWVLGNVMVRPIDFDHVTPRADGVRVVDGHAHNFPHVTYVRRGAVRFDKLDAEGAVIKSVDKRASDGYNFVLIEAGVKHRLTALEEHSAADCIYAHRNPQGEVVQAYDGWTPGYV